MRQTKYQCIFDILSSFEQLSHPTIWWLLSNWWTLEIILKAKTFSERKWTQLQGVEWHQETTRKETFPLRLIYLSLCRLWRLIAVRMKTVCESLDYKTSTKLPCLHNVHSIYNTPKEKTLLALIIGRLFSKFYWAVLAVLNSHALLLAIVLKIRWCSVVNTANDDTVTEIRTDFQRSSENDFSSPLKWSISPSVPVVTLIH